jgi:hypothetical protein
MMQQAPKLPASQRICPQSSERKQRGQRAYENETKQNLLAVTGDGHSK